MGIPVAHRAVCKSPPDREEYTVGLEAILMVVLVLVGLSAVANGLPPRGKRYPPLGGLGLAVLMIAVLLLTEWI